MKTIIAVIFSLLVALTVAAGVYFGFTNYRNTRAIIQSMDSLRVEIAALESQIITRNTDLVGEATALRASLDSLRAAIAGPEENLRGRFLRQGALSRVPGVELSEPQDSGSWRVYTFELYAEGSQVALDSFLVGLSRDLRLVCFERFDVAVSLKKIKLEAGGRVSIPKEFE